MPKKRRHCDDVDSIDERVNAVRKALRHVQNLSNCATSTLDLVLKHLQPFLKGLEKVKGLKMRAVRSRCKSRSKKTLHGCIGCNQHVFGPTSRERVCPQCGNARYNNAGKPNEICWYFPFREQIRRLINMPVYRELLMHEKTHRRLRRC